MNHRCVAVAHLSCVVTLLTLASLVTLPQSGVMANCVAIRWFQKSDIFAAAARGIKADMITVHAARELQPGEELFFHYGGGYLHRTWD